MLSAVNPTWTESLSQQRRAVSAPHHGARPLAARSSRGALPVSTMQHRLVGRASPRDSPRITGTPSHRRPQCQTPAYGINMQGPSSVHTTTPLPRRHQHPGVSTQAARRCGPEEPVRRCSSVFIYRAAVAAYKHTTPFICSSTVNQGCHGSSCSTSIPPQHDLKKKKEISTKRH